jgi:hypothetical protein
MTATTHDAALPRHPGRVLTAAVALVVGLALGTGVTLIATDDGATSPAAVPSARVATAEHPRSADAAEHWNEASAGSRAAACVSPNRSTDAIERCIAGR